jgi:hypothetical protein
LEDPREPALPHTFRCRDPAWDRRAAPLPEWWGDGDAPLVYVTFGSVAGGMEMTAHVFAVALDAVAELPVRVLLTVGHGADLDALPSLPGNVHVERWVPQADVLARASAVVGHGGSGTTRTPRWTSWHAKSYSPFEDDRAGADEPGAAAQASCGRGGSALRGPDADAGRSGAGRARVWAPEVRPQWRRRREVRAQGVHVLLAAHGQVRQAAAALLSRGSTLPRQAVPCRAFGLLQRRAALHVLRRHSRTRLRAGRLHRLRVELLRGLSAVRQGRRVGLPTRDVLPRQQLPGRHLRHSLRNGLEAARAKRGQRPDARSRPPVTERERLDRESLLRRAAAAAGALYAAPVLTSSAAPAVDRKCGRRRCQPGQSGDVKCREKGCMCCDPATGRCTKGRSRCCRQDPRCPPNHCPADVAVFCNAEATCICWIPLPSDGGCSPNECVDFPSNFCADYPPCDRRDGSGCPPGMCCLDTTCPTGVCSTPCGTGSRFWTGRTSGSGPTIVR